MKSFYLFYFCPALYFSETTLVFPVNSQPSNVEYLLQVYLYETDDVVVAVAAITSSAPLVHLSPFNTYSLDGQV